MVVSAAALLYASGLACSSATGAAVDARARIATQPAIEIRATGDEALPLSLPAACQATGIEACFNASDDDCDGIVDEGCGLSTGVLQLVVAWDRAEANVNLELLDPNGESAEVGRTTALGLSKDRDCPGPNDECGGQNFEVVTLVGDELPRGRYRLRVELELPAPAVPSVNVQIGGHIGSAPTRGSCVLSPRNPRRSAELWMRDTNQGAAALVPPP